MKKKYLIYLALFVLATATIWFLFSKKGNHVTLIEKQLFIKNPQTITKIILKNSTDKVILTANENEWKVNDKFKINRKSLDLLFLTLRKIEVIAHISSEKKETILEKINKKGITIDIFSKRKIKSLSMIYISNEGNYLSLKDSKYIFRIHIDGTSLKDYTKFFSTEENYWRDNLIINYFPENIEGVKIEYTQNPGQSFSLFFNPDSTVLLNDKGKRIMAELDTSYIQTYQYYFSGISAYYPSKNETPNKGNLFATVTIFLTNENKMVYNLYRKIMFSNSTKSVDMYNCIGKLARNKELFKLKYMDIDPILRELRDFIKK